MPNVSLPDARAQRGIRLYLERGDEIVAYVDGTYGVPSRTEEGVLYDVDLEAETCECPDRVYPCLHAFSAELKNAERIGRGRSEAGAAA